MIIRKATIEDSKAIATYLLMAMEEILYTFIGKDDSEEAIKLLYHFVPQENNQYSYQNCLVVEKDAEIIAAANIYDGKKLDQLRTPIARYIEQYFHKIFDPEDETEAGEFYIDSLAVHPKHQGKGIGAKILQFIIEDYVYRKKKTIGLLVDQDNPGAHRLYSRLGFISVGKKTLARKTLWHLQVNPKPESQITKSAK